MHKLITSFLIAAVIIACHANKPSHSRIKSILQNINKEEAFEEYRNLFNKSYSNLQDRIDALQQFRQQVTTVNSHNLQQSSYTLSLNAFSDWPKRRLQRLYGFINKSFNEGGDEFNDDPTVANEIDWSTGDTKYLPDVKDQGECGSCWAFTVQATIESHLKIQHKELVSLSEQNLVSCDDTNSGCNGGNMNMAYNWIKLNRGVCSGYSYPYTAKDDPCLSSCENGYIASVTGYAYITTEELLKRALNIGPVAAGVQSSSPVFQAYSTGIIDDSACGTDVDHAVTVVGYGTENGVDYWKIRNSWGADWGEGGYFRIKRGENICGINSMLSMPTGVTLLRSPTSDESLFVSASGLPAPSVGGFLFAFAASAIGFMLPF